MSSTTAKVVISEEKMRTAGVVTRMLLIDRGDYNVLPPNWEPLESDVIFDESGLPIPEVLKMHFKREGVLSEKDALHLITRCAMIWRNEPNVVLLRHPVVVCGDIHGQFYDLLTLLDIGGDPAQQRYVFLGDYIDRGCFGMEVILLLMAYKICYPETFVMLRGNHESRHLTSYFNFKREVLYKYSLPVYNAMMSAFDCLPLCCLWENRFLCVHGGISPEIARLDDINAIHRFREPPSSGPMGDLLWSDPMDEKESDPTSTQMFVPNTTRGCSYVYSHAAACKFIAENKLTTIIRGHEAQGEGFHLYKKTPRGFPAVICIFSAPNYCDTYNNRAAVIMLDKNVMNIRQYNSKEHPYYLPNYINAFEWSLTFVAEKLSGFCSTLLTYDTSLLHQLIDKATVHIENDSHTSSISNHDTDNNSSNNNNNNINTNEYNTSAMQGMSIKNDKKVDINQRKQDVNKHKGAEHEKSEVVNKENNNDDRKAKVNSLESNEQSTFLTSEQHESICCKLATINTISRMYNYLHSNNVSDNSIEDNKNSQSCNNSINKDDDNSDGNKDNRHVDGSVDKQIDIDWEPKHKEHELHLDAPSAVEIAEEKECIAKLAQFGNQEINNTLDVDETISESSMNLDSPAVTDLMMVSWPNIPLEDETTTEPNAVTEALQMYDGSNVHFFKK